MAFTLVNTMFWYSVNGEDSNFWLDAFLMTLFLTTAGMALTGLIESVGACLTSVARLVLGRIDHVMNSFWGSGLDFFDITGVAFLFIDFAFMITYLGLYINSLG